MYTRGGRSANSFPLLEFALPAARISLKGFAYVKTNSNSARLRIFVHYAFDVMPFMMVAGRLSR
jgi:hypothetical protein